MRSSVPFIIAILTSFLILSTTSGKEEVIPFPYDFLFKYLEHRSMRRVNLFSNIGYGAFRFAFADVKKLVSSASSRFVQINVLPFQEFANRTSAVEPPQTLVPGHFIVLLYDNSTGADNHLMEASSANLFPAKYKWLILTRPAFYESLQDLLLNLDVRVDSDITTAIAHTDGNIELYDIYILGKTLHETHIGEWKFNNTASKGTGGVSGCQNVTENCSGSLAFVDVILKSFLRSNFYGFHLKVVTVNVNAFYTVTTMDPTDKSILISGGYFGEVFNMLSEAMNFTYSVNLLDGYAYGVVLSSSNGVPVWSGIVGELQNKKADVTACEVSLLPERELIMDYSFPLQIISRRLYIHRPMRAGVGAGGSKSEATWYRGGGFVRPFAVHVWLCITASLLLFLAASRLHARLTFPRRSVDAPSKKEQSVAIVMEDEPSGPPTLSSDFFRFMATLVQQGLPDDPDPDEAKGEVDSTQSRRLILWTASVTYLIVYTSYGAKLASILASESEPQPPFTDLDGLLMMSNWKLGFIDKGLGRVAFESAKADSVIGRLWAERVAPDLSVLVPDIVTGLRKALEGQYAFLEFHTGVQAVLVQSLDKKEDSTFTTSEVCRILTLPHDYLKGGIAFGFQEESPIRTIFNSWILAIRSCGILDRMAKTWLPEALPCLEEPTVATVGLIDIAPALSALGFGIAVSVVALLLEIIYDFHSNKEYLLPFYH